MWGEIYLVPYKVGTSRMVSRAISPPKMKAIRINQIIRFFPSFINLLLLSGDSISGKSQFAKNQSGCKGRKRVQVSKKWLDSTARLSHPSKRSRPRLAANGENQQVPFRPLMVRSCWDVGSILAEGHFPQKTSLTGFVNRSVREPLTQLSHCVTGVSLLVQVS